LPQYDFLSVSADEFITHIDLANPERRNALNDELLIELIEALTLAARDTRVAILGAQSASGVWCAGFDITSLPTDGSMPDPATSPFDRALATVRELPIPVIAVVDGGAWGGGCNLALACDLIVATNEASFAITPAKLGVAYDSAGVADFLATLPVNIAREMFFTAEPVTAARLESLGVVNSLHDSPGAANEVAHSMARIIASRAPLSLRSIKAEIAAQISPGQSDTAALLRMREKAWASEDFREGRAAFTERRSPHFRGE
jgi:methylmalonyl-CoA decarboxylase